MLSHHRIEPRYTPVHDGADDGAEAPGHAQNGALAHGIVAVVGDAPPIIVSDVSLGGCRLMVRSVGTDLPATGGPIEFRFAAERCTSQRPHRVIAARQAGAGPDEAPLAFCSAVFATADRERVGQPLTRGVRAEWSSLNRYVDWQASAAQVANAVERLYDHLTALHPDRTAVFADLEPHSEPSPVVRRDVVSHLVLRRLVDLDAAHADLRLCGRAEVDEYANLLGSISVGLLRPGMGFFPRFNAACTLYVISAMSHEFGRRTGLRMNRYTRIASPRDAARVMAIHLGPLADAHGHGDANEVLSVCRHFASSHF